MTDRPSQLDTELGVSQSGSAPVRRDRLEIQRGDLLGRYLVLDVIGRGGMGAVYAAYDPELDRKLAIKLILAPRRGDHEDQQRLLREAQATAQLNHPNVITVHDVGTHQGRVFVAMEFVDGGTLREWIEAGPHPWRAVLERMIAAGRGLAAAHRVGLVHRDFKPANVLIGSDGRLRVADFGLARRVGGPDPEPTTREHERSSSSTDELITARHSTLSSKLTMTGARVGTPAYMAPEQHEGVEIDARADQFGFCVALWEALYGERPFAGESLPALLFAIEQGRIREPSRGVRVPAWLRRVVLRGLARQVDARWPDMDALLAALARDPSRQTATWSLVGAVGLAIAATVAAVVHERPHEASEPCAGAAAAFADTYEDDDRRAIAARFADRGAATTAEVLMPALDHWADDWRTQWRDTCEATQVRGEQSAELFDRRMACLERHRRRLHGLVELLREADGELLFDALSGLDTVGSPSACERESLLGGVAPPEDAEQRAEVDRLVAELDAVGVLLAVGEAVPALERLAEIEPEVVAAGWLPLQTELTWMRGDALGRQREFAASEQALTEAAEQAIAIGDDRLAIEALLDQATFGTEWEPRARESLRLLGIAEALTERVGSPPDLLSKIELTRARVHNLDGSWQPALEAAERSLAHAAQAEPEPQLMTADAEHAIAAALFRMGRFAEGLPHVDRALELWTRTLGANNDRLHRAYNIRALYAIELGRYDEAIAALGDELILVEARYGGDHLNISDVLVNLGWAYEEAGRLDEAREVIERSLAIREREVGPDNLYVGHTRANLSNVLRRLGLLDQALAEAERAREIIEAERGLDHGEMIIMMNMLANIRADRGEHERAREHLLVALDMLRRPEHENPPNQWSALVMLGRSEAALGRAEQALELLASAAALPGFTPTSEDQSEFDWTMARALAAAGKRAEARESIDRAIDRLDPDNAGHAKPLADMRRWRDQTL
ncbi:MAG TPA: serine/threonine-protein kinase [Enhygromyxa sp.]|nr:serine/threonine-protein kinase [Enhygromyxa sp.]